MIALGIDIGGTFIKGAFVQEDGSILSRFMVPVNHDLSSEEFLADLADNIKNEAAKNHIEFSKIAGIGIGCPGSIDSGKGVCDYSNNLHWEKFPIANLLSSALQKTVKVANDANVAALGEALYGQGKGYRDMVFITLGTGVGSGLFLNGQLYEGNKGKGAELGHTLLVMNGRKCTCGRRGCAEAYCSVSALIGDTKKALRADKNSLMWEGLDNNLANVNGHTAFEAAKKGDPSAQKVVRNYIAYLGEFLLNVTSAFRPQAIILGGGLSGQKEALTGPLKDYLEERGYGFGGEHAPKVEIFVSPLGNDAGVIGAASLILHPDYLV